MKIEQLTVENFKCFKREQTFDFSRLTILTGANSSGKSTVMQAVLMMLQSDDFPRELSTNGDFVNLGDFKEISNRQISKNIISFGLKITHDDKLEIKTSWEEDNEDNLPKLLKSEVKFNNEIFNGGIHQNEYMTLNNVAKHINYISAFRQSPQRTYFEKNKADFKLGREGEGFLEQIVEWEKRANGKIKELIEVMSAFDLIEEIKTKRLSGGRFEISVRSKNSPVLTDLSHVGSAVSQFLPIIVADLQLPNDSTLFLAEPEIHLHPSVQAKFIDYIIHKINTTDKNYIIETHSEYFLNRIRLAIVKNELDKAKLSVYYLENKKEDTNVHKVDFTKTGGIRHAPDSFFETYLTDIMEITLNAVAE